MKGRKTIGKAIALGLAVCAMFGLVSCASVSSKAKHMKSQEVSEAAWEKIFGYGADFDVVFSDCEVVYQREMTRETYIDGVKSKITSSEMYTFVMDGAKQYLSVSSSQKGKYGDIKVDEEEPEEERYSIKNEDGTYTIYRKNAAAEWTSSVSYLSYGVAADTLDDLLSLLYWYRFDDYVFSEARRGYVDADDFEGDGYVVKFDKEGRISGLCREYEDFSGDTLTHFELGCTFYYKDLEIKLPSI